MLKIPESVKRMNNNVESVCKLFTKGLLSTGGGSLFVYLCNELVKVNNCNNYGYYADDEEQEIIRHRLSSDLLEGF